MEEVFYHTLNPLSAILGERFIKLGLREKDRKFNQMIKKFRDVATHFVQNKIVEIEADIAKNGELK